MLGRRQNGFTLVEVLVVMAIISFVSATALFAVPSLFEGFRLQRGTDGLTGAIREAQFRAVAEGRLWRVALDADGKGYTLQHAELSTANSNCDSPGWYVDKSVSLPAGVTISGKSRSCVTFGSSGRAEWPSPYVVAGATTPSVGGDDSLLRIVDGAVVSSSEMATWSVLGDATHSNNTIAWKKASAPSVAFTVDLREIRQFQSACLGMVAWPNNANYPLALTVKGTQYDDLGNPPADPSKWTPLYTGSTLPNPPANTKQRSCMQIPVNGSFRYFSFQLAYNGQWIILDEFDVANLYINLSTAHQTRQLVVKPVTGRVSIQ